MCALSKGVHYNYKYHQNGINTTKYNVVGAIREWASR